MSIYRKTYEHDGRTKTVRVWRVEIRDHVGDVFTFSGFRDKDATRGLEAKARQLVDCRAAGIAPSRELREWIEALPPRLRTRFHKRGLLTGEEVAAMRPLSELREDFRTYMRTNECAP